MIKCFHHSNLFRNGRPPFCDISKYRYLIWGFSEISSEQYTVVFLPILNKKLKIVFEGRISCRPCWSKPVSKCRTLSPSLPRSTGNFNPGISRQMDGLIWERCAADTSVFCELLKTVFINISLFFSTVFFTSLVFKLHIVVSQFIKYWLKINHFTGGCRLLLWLLSPK